MNALTPAPHNPTQRYGQSLPPQQRSKHRAWIGVKVEAVLHGYFKEKPSDAVWAEIQRGWMEQLETFTEKEIRTAFTTYVGDNPTRRPNEGAIRQLCEGQRKIAIAEMKASSPVKAERQPHKINEAQKAEADNLVAQFTRRAGGAV